MTTRVLIHNEGPGNAIVDDGAVLEVIHPEEKRSFYVYTGRKVVVFEEGDNHETS